MDSLDFLTEDDSTQMHPGADEGPKGPEEQKQLALRRQIEADENILAKAVRMFRDVVRAPFRSADVDESVTAVLVQSQLNAEAISRGLARRVESLTITTDDEYLAAGELLRDIVTKAKILEEERKQITAPVDGFKKRVMEWYKVPQGLLEDAERVCRKARNTYNQEQERKRQEEQLRADEEARQERLRLEIEAKKKREEADRIAAAAFEGDAPVTPLEATEIVGQAEIDRQRLQQEADDLLAQKERTLAPVVQVAKSRGISQRTVYTAVLVDASLVPDQFWVIDDKTIQAMAKAMKDNFAVPGYKLEKRQEESVRTTV